MGKSKAKGTRAESKVVKYLDSFGIQSERRALAGTHDVGDVLVQIKHGDKVINKVILEVKAGKQTANPNRAMLRKWMAEASAESFNAGIPEWYLVVVRYNRKIDDADVWTMIDDSFGDNFGLIRCHMYLDELARQLADLGGNDHGSKAHQSR